MPERQGQPRGRRDDTGQADDGHEADQHLDDLRGSGARVDGRVGVGAVGRHGTPTGDQGGEADEGQRLRVEITSASHPEGR